MAIPLEPGRATSWPPPLWERPPEDLWCLRVDLDRSLSGLPRLCRRLLTLLHEGRSEREMARLLGMTRGEVQTWLRRTFRHLRARADA
jgi:DNA-directed RNA polymerase specialized sigma24 family protein